MSRERELDRAQSGSLFRKVVLCLAIFVGAVEFAGGLFVAVLLTNPLYGLDPWESSLLAFLLSGPMALLPAAVMAIRRPHLAGVWLLTAALVSSVAAVWLMTPQPGTWSGGPGMSEYVFKWSLTLILPFSLPMLLLGLLLLCKGNTWVHLYETSPKRDAAMPNEGARDRLMPVPVWRRRLLAGFLVACAAGAIYIIWVNLYIRSQQRIVTPNELRETPTHAQVPSKQITGVVFSPDGKFLATSGEDWTVKLWDATTVQDLRTFQGHKSEVLSVAFSPNGKLVASGSTDETARLWDSTATNEVATLVGHSGFVRAVAFSPSGEILATGSWDKTVKLWDVATHVELATLSGHTDAIKSVAFSADGKTLATGSVDKTIRLWDVVQREELATLVGHEAQVLSVAFNPENDLLASGSEDKTVRFWDVTARKQRSVLRGHATQVWSVAFSPNGTILASAGDDGVVKLWDVDLEAEMGMVKAPGRVYSVAFSTGGRKLATGGSSGGFVVWGGESALRTPPSQREEFESSPLNLWDVPD